MEILRSFNFVIALFLALFITTPCAILRPFNPKNNKAIMNTLKFLIYFFCGVRVRSEGYEIIERTHPSVAISNHQHNLDAAIASGFFTKHMVVLGKHELMYVPYFGQIYWLFGNLFIKRGNRRKSLESMKNLEKRVINEKLSVLIFPEGTRNPNDELLSFKKGAFLTAIKTQVPIVPISVSQYKAKGQLKKFRMVDVYVKVHDPIETTGLEKKDIPELIKKSRAIIEQGIVELNKKYDQ